jgi:hypothetical protein
VRRWACSERDKRSVAPACKKAASGVGAGGVGDMLLVEDIPRSASDRRLVIDEPSVDAVGESVGTRAVLLHHHAAATSGVSTRLVDSTRRSSMLIELQIARPCLFV